MANNYCQWYIGNSSPNFQYYWNPETGILAEMPETTEEARKTIKNDVVGVDVSRVAAGEHFVKRWTGEEPETNAWEPQQNGPRFRALPTGIGSKQHFYALLLSAIADAAARSKDMTGAQLFYREHPVKNAPPQDHERFDPYRAPHAQQGDFSFPMFGYGFIGRWQLWEDCPSALGRTQTERYGTRREYRTKTLLVRNADGEVVRTIEKKELTGKLIFTTPQGTRRFTPKCFELITLLPLLNTVRCGVEPERKNNKVRKVIALGVDTESETGELSDPRQLPWRRRYTSHAQSDGTSAEIHPLPRGEAFAFPEPEKEEDIQEAVGRLACAAIPKALLRESRRRAVDVIPVPGWGPARAIFVQGQYVGLNIPIVTI